MRWYRWLAGLCLVASLILATPRVTHAHANPTRAEPGIEAVVPTAPPQLRVWFSEELASQGGSLEVWDSTNARVDQGDARIDMNDPDRKLMVVSLNPLNDGVYTVNWKSVSRDDGHEASGSFRFGVGANTVLPPRDSAGPAPRISIASVNVDGHTVTVQVNAEGIVIGDSAAGMPASMDHSAMDHSAMDHSAMDHGTMGQGASTQEGHLHAYLDGVMLQMAYTPTITLTDVPSGTHQLQITLSNNAHQDYDPPVTASTTITVP